jgi:hypothetical protein
MPLALSGININKRAGANSSIHLQVGRTFVQFQVSESVNRVRCQASIYSSTGSAGRRTHHKHTSCRYPLFLRSTSHLLSREKVVIQDHSQGLRRAEVPSRV